MLFFLPEYHSSPLLVSLENLRICPYVHATRTPRVSSVDWALGWVPGMGWEPGSPGRPCSHRACVLGRGYGQTVTGIQLDEQDTHVWGGLAGRHRRISTGKVQEGPPKVMASMWRAASTWGPEGRGGVREVCWKEESEGGTSMHEEECERKSEVLFTLQVSAR